MRLVNTIFYGLCSIWKQLNKKRYSVYHKSMVLTAFAVAAAVVYLCMEGFGGADYHQQSASTLHEEASQNHVQEEEKETLAGIKGVLNGISNMEKFSAAADEKEIPDAGVEVLVGASSAHNRQFNKMTMERGLGQAEGVTYSASVIVRERQMPYKDYEALLKIVESEATGSDLKGKILVANVVLNRVKDSHFPDNVYDVVWERSGGDPQFSPTADGRIDTVEISKSTIEAVDKALEGEDYSEGALFFMAKSDSDEVNVQWFENKLERLFEYGGHEFYTYPDS